MNTAHSSKRGCSTRSGGVQERLAIIPTPLPPSCAGVLGALQPLQFPAEPQLLLGGRALAAERDVVDALRGDRPANAIGAQLAPSEGVRFLAFLEECEHGVRGAPAARALRLRHGDGDLASGRIATRASCELARRHGGMAVGRLYASAVTALETLAKTVPSL
jgi:hypothetical protein